MRFTSRPKIVAALASLLVGFSLLNPYSAAASAPWGSIAFDGTQYLSSTNMSAPGTSDFTYEVWFYSTVEKTTSQFIMNTRSNISFPQLQDGFDLMVRPDRSLGASYRSYWLSESAVDAIKINRWYHFALVRIGSNIYGYLNGTQISAKALEGQNFSSTVMQIGSTLGGANKFTGNIANVRYVKSAVYTSDFTKVTDDFTNITDTSILMNTKNDGTFATNAISGTTFTNNGAAIASSMNPFDWNAEQDRLNAQNSSNSTAEERAKRDAARAAEIRAARARINYLLSTNQTVAIKDLSDADLPFKSVDSLLLAYKELLSVKYSLTKPLSDSEAYALKYNTFMKYAMYERLQGISTGAVYGSDLVKYGVISADTPMKQLTTSQLMKQPVSTRDSIEKINAFFKAAHENYLARKAHLADVRAKLQSR